MAIFLKAYDTKRVMQRVAPVATFCEARWLTWLRVMNHFRFNVYVSVNAITPHRRERTKAAVSEVRHIFLDVDRDGPRVLDHVVSEPGLPMPSYVVHSSPGRLQLLWRTSRVLSRPTPSACRSTWPIAWAATVHATAVSQTMRVPGFENRKYWPPPVVGVEYGAEASVYEPVHFPEPPVCLAHRSRHGPNGGRRLTRCDRTRRSERGAISPPYHPPWRVKEEMRGPSVSVVVSSAGSRLDATVALQLLAAWNARCEPPWSEAGADREVGTRAPLRARADGRTARRRPPSVERPRVSSPRTRPHGLCASPGSLASQDPGEHSRCRRPRPSAVLEDTVAKEKGSVVSVKIVRTEQGAPPGKLADAELIFEAGSGPLSGLRLIGFAVWERRDGGKNVTFPARQVLRQR